MLLNDSYNELKMNYEKTPSYSILKAEIDRLTNLHAITKEQGDLAIIFAINEYIRHVYNDRNAWDIIKDCLIQIPIPLSVIDMVPFKHSMKKHYYVVYDENKYETTCIFETFGILFSTYRIISKNEPQTCFVYLENGISSESLDTSIGRKIFIEMERHMIPLNYFFYSWDKQKESKMLSDFYGYLQPSPFWGLFGYRGKRDRSNDSRINHSGYRVDLDCAFRSSWEANIARILNKKEIKWEYEKHTFEFNLSENDKYSLKHYLPDFFIGNNIIIEVKGFWEPTSRNRAKYFSQQYKQFKYCIVDQDMYANLKSVYKPIIPEWEEDGFEQIESEILQVVGLSFGERKQTFKTLDVGQSVNLMRNPNNKFDPNALLVLTRDGCEIGFISSDWSCIYSPKIDLGMTFNAQIVSIDPKVLNIKVNRNNPSVEVMYDLFK